MHFTIPRQLEKINVCGYTYNVLTAFQTQHDRGRGEERGYHAYTQTHITFPW